MHGGKRGDERLAALAALCIELQDEFEIGWRAHGFEWLVSERGARGCLPVPRPALLVAAQVARWWSR